MDAFYERLMVRAATIDEVLSDAFEALPGQKGDTDIAARRLAAWCRSCASGDWSLSDRRLERDGWSIGYVLARFGTVRRKAGAPPPAWLTDAIWIEAALLRPGKKLQSSAPAVLGETCVFEDLFIWLVRQAVAQLSASADAQIFDNLDDSALACLQLSLLKQISSLLAPALYARFAQARKSAGLSADAAKPQPGDTTSRYDQFVAEMKAGGFRRLFEDKPVLLRLIASITRQWIETSREFLTRLHDDLPTIRRDLLQSAAARRIVSIESELSDPHNLGRTVQIVGFEDGSRVVYKPKDLKLDAAWHVPIERLNRDGAPVALEAARALPRDGYGWSEFVNHTGCADAKGHKRFFRRAGAWLALFHWFAGTDMHRENIIADGDHPVPIDLEMLLQAAAEQRESDDGEAQAFDAAMEAVAKSVIAVGLLPAYGKSLDNNIFAIGGVTSASPSRTTLAWTNINSDDMRPSKASEIKKTMPNLPHVDGSYAKLGDHVEEFVAGFEDYATFLLHETRDANAGDLFDGFAGFRSAGSFAPRDSYMLLQRLKDHRQMDDGIAWSAQADFMARLTDWEKASDRMWPLQRAERAGLLALNVPYFTMRSDGDKFATRPAFRFRRCRVRVWIAHGRVSGISMQRTLLGRSRSSGRIPGRLSRTGKTAPNITPKQLSRLPATSATRETWIAEAGAVAEHLSRYAIRRGAGAAWIGLDWLGDSEVSQLIALGPDLYNGACGIAIFLAAHAAVSGRRLSEELARAALVNLRKNLRGRNSARMARSLGIGGATGLGSIVYALTVLSTLLRDEQLLADAYAAAELFTDDIVAADSQLDVMGGSAGAILCLLRLYRQDRSRDVRERATRCGRHLLVQRRFGAKGLRSWSAPGFGSQPLNGMAHGAAGFAYALAALAAVTGHEEFADAAFECIAFENASYDAERNNWPDFRGGAHALWPCQWCHGATGIGLARAATSKTGALDSRLLATDIEHALAGVERGWPGHVDTLCCGTLGSVEFIRQAGIVLGRCDLQEAASRRLIAVLETAAATGGYRWNGGKSRFNLGLLRGLAGVGYTVLRQADPSLPNVLIWE